MNRKTLTLRPTPIRLTKPKPQPPTPADPQRIALSNALGIRYICRDGRYIQQVTVLMPVADSPAERTWVDIPLVPEVYYG
jgi:hypothetical protein